MSSEYTELVERAEFAATSAKNSAAQTKSDKDTVVSLYNEIKAIIDAGGGGGSCKFYECASVGDTTWSGYEWLLVTKEVEIEPVVNSYILTATSDWGGNGEYVKSTEMSDGCPVYVNGDYKLFRIAVSTTTHYWCAHTTIVTSPGSADVSEAHNEDTPPASLGGGWCTVTPVTSEQEPIYVQMYEKSSVITSNLTWTSVKPKVGKSYTEDALVEVTPYTGSIEIADMVFYAPLDSIDVKIGSTLTNSGSVFFDENNGIKCARFNGSNCLLATDVIPTGSGQLTCCWWSKLDAQTNEAWVFMLGASGSYRESFFGRYYDYTGFDLSLSNYEVQNTGIIDHTAWSFITMVYTGAEMCLYINGEKKVSEPYSGFNLSSGALSIGRDGGGGPTGYMASVRIFTRALTEAEITLLYEEHSDKI